MKKILAVLSALILVPGFFVAAQAAQSTQPVLQRDNQFSWTAINFGITDQHYDYAGYSSDRTLFSGDISYAVAPHFNIVGGLGYSSDSGVSVFDVNAGLGYHLSLIKNLDLFADVRAIVRNTDAYTSSTDTGYKIRAGGRFRFTKALEARAGLYHADVVGTENGIFGSILYHFNKQWGIGGNVGANDNHTVSFGIFGHVNF